MDEKPTTVVRFNHRRKKKYNLKIKNHRTKIYFCFQAASGEGLRINEEIISNQPPLIIRTARSTSTKSTPNTTWIQFQTA